MHRPQDERLVLGMDAGSPGRDGLGCRARFEAQQGGPAFVAHDGAAPEVPVPSAEIRPAQRQLESLLAFPQRLGGHLGFPPAAGFFERPPDRRDQPVQPVFEHVIGRAVAQGRDRFFLAHRAGDENEGNVPLLGADQVQGLMSVKAGHAVVGEHHVRRAGEQQSLKRRGILREVQIALQPFLAQRLTDQLRVQRLIFEMQNGEFAVQTGGCFTPLAAGASVRLPGGGGWRKQADRVRHPIYRAPEPGCPAAGWWRGRG